MSGKTGRLTCPHDHGRLLGVYHMGTADAAGQAVKAAVGNPADALRFE
jgi:hypothetical protein